MNILAESGIVTIATIVIFAVIVKTDITVRIVTIDTTVKTVIIVIFYPVYPINIIVITGIIAKTGI